MCVEIYMLITNPPMLALQMKPCSIKRVKAVMHEMPDVLLPMQLNFDF